MDTSETYIKMCDCPEIQGLYDLRDSHSFYHCVHPTCQDGDAIYESPYTAKTIWLPRQDQLQEMVGSYAEQCDCLGGYIDWDAKKQGWTFPFACVSMEQLWLAFVMKERYNKTWAEGEWHKEG